MTNFEKYKDVIEEILNDDDCIVPAVMNGVPAKCADIPCCFGCDFEDSKYPDCSTCWIDFIGWACEDDGADCLPDASKSKAEEHDGCDGCKYEYKGGDESPCTECSMNYMSKFERRPKKTRQDEFLEMFPNAKTNPLTGVLIFCPVTIDENVNVNCVNCNKCKKDYWLQEVEE